MAIIQSSINSLLQSTLQGLRYSGIESKSERAGKEQDQANKIALIEAQTALEAQKTATAHEALKQTNAETRQIKARTARTQALTEREKARQASMTLGNNSEVHMEESKAQVRATKERKK